MGAMAWWLIPIGATALALAWAALRTRPTREPDPHEAMADQARFREAMERPLPRLEARPRDPRDSQSPGSDPSR